MKIKKIMAGIASLSMLAMPAVVPVVSSAQVVAGGFGDQVGQLFVLDRLFNGPFGTGGGFTTYGDLLLWNQLMNGGISNSLFGYGLGNVGLFGLYGLDGIGNTGYGVYGTGYGGYGDGKSAAAYAEVK